MNTLIIFLLFIPVLVFVLLLLNLLLAPHQPDLEKVGPYECGFSIIYGQTGEKFTISFYTVGVLFIIFDLEILLLYPLSVVLYDVQFYGFTIFFLFFIILTVGFIFEFGSGSLNFTNHKNDLTKNSIIQ